MLNFIWAGMILIGVSYAALQGNLADVTNAALESSKDAITLCLTMLGVMCFWMGMMEIATKAGIIGGISRILRPFIRIIYQYCCQYAWTWVGCHTSWITSDGGIRKTTGRKKRKSGDSK